MGATLPAGLPGPREGYIPVDMARLYYRAIGQGPPLLVLHGGPDFDHTYLLPDLDRLAAVFRLLYYDQRGRGKSAAGVEAATVSLASDIADIDAVRAYFHLDAVAVLGHSFGALLALAYALGHPTRVSHLVLLNPAPASYADWMLFRQERRARAPADLQAIRDLASSPAYRQGDPDTVAALYRLHYRATLRHPEHLDRLMGRLRASFTHEGILKARAIEERLNAETVESRSFDLLPQLQGLCIPTLVLRGEDDFCPPACAAHIAQAIPGARLVVLRDCGHFSYLEQPDHVRSKIGAFVQGT